jgi:hypothetical protein
MKVGRKQQHGGRGQIARRFGSLPPSTERIMERYQGEPLVELGLARLSSAEKALFSLVSTCR